MKSVRTRIILTMCTLVVSSLLVVSVVSVYLNLRTTNGTLEQTMQEMAEIASLQVSNHLRVYKVVTENAAADERVYNPSEALKEKQAVLDELVSSHQDLTRGNILDKDGTSVFTGDNFSDREYFKKAMQGQTWVSDPVVSKVTGAISIIIAAPIWQDGIYGSSVTGVLYMVPTETFLNDIVSKIKVSPNAGAQIINNKGTVIAHPSMDFVANESNAQENEKSDPAMAPIAALEREMMAQKIGFGTYSMNGVKKYLGYAPIENSNGWSIGVNAPVSDFMSYTNMSIIITSVLLVVAVAISLIVSLRLANGIGKPLSALSGILSSIAETGQVDIGADATRQQQAYIEKKDEIGTLARSAAGLIEMLESKVENLNDIANGNLDVDIIRKSDNDAIGNALTQMVDNLNQMFAEIYVASTQVSTGASQIADGSQSLAQGSVEQAASVDQLSSSVSDVADKTVHNADMAKQAASLSDTIKQNAEKGNSQMEQMMQAVKDITDASNSISKVMKVIDDIAFQTNILALNAAVEAARAGQHGKGFAVVADEVRNLAAKSAEAAKDTGGLISDSITKSQMGYQMATDTAASLQQIVDGIGRSAEIVAKIAESSDEQTDAIMQVNKGIQQVAQVIQQNSATSQQSAAASEEMSGQAHLLQQLISRFKLRGSNSQGYAANKISPADAETNLFAHETGFTMSGSKY